MKLKMIGGERDGDYWHVDPLFRPGDIVKVASIPLTSLAAYNAMHLPQNITCDELIYRVTYFCFSKDDIYKFLVSEYPIKLTDKEAIMLQFNKKEFQFYDPTINKLRKLTQEDLDKINAIHGYVK